MKLFTKHQIKVMLLLNCVIIVLIAGLFFVLPGRKGGGTPAGTTPVDPPAHEKVRDARVSLSPYLNWETNLGGSGNDDVLSVHRYGNSVHIFGNSDSSDYDFDGAAGHIYMASLSATGQTERFTYLGAKSDYLEKVTICEGGYLLACNDLSSKGTPYLMVVGYDGTVTKTVSLARETPQAEQIVDVLIDETGYLAVIETADVNTKSRNYRVVSLDAALDVKAERLLSRSFDLEYLALFPLGGGKYVLAANINSPLLNCLTFASFDFLGTPQFKDVTAEKNYFCKSVVPYSRGFAALVIETEKSVPGLWTFNTKFERVTDIRLNLPAATDGALFYAENTYYCFINLSADASCMLTLDESFNPIEDGKLDRFTNVSEVTDMISNGRSTLFVGKTASGVAVVGYSGGMEIFFARLGGDRTESNMRLALTADSLMMVCQSDSAGGDVGGNFGNRDVWAASVKLSIQTT